MATLEILASNRLREIGAVEVPSRAHGVVAAGTPGEVIVCARRPGAWLMRIRVADGTVLARYDNDGERWLQGHTCLSHDGAAVFAGEVDLEERSTIGVFDAKTLRRIATLPSGGVEPHELLAVDASTLLIAHGGRRNTLREGDAVAGNARCESSLTWLDAKTGKVLYQHGSDDVRISLRHLATITPGRWAVGAQSDAVDPLPMVAIADRKTLTWLTNSGAQAANYVASVAADRFGILAAAPHSGHVMHWAADGQWKDAYPIERASGVVVLDDTPWISTEEGRIISSHCKSISSAGSFPRAIWDNHLQFIAM